MSRLVDLTGKRFGRLTVVKRSEDYVSKNGNHKTMWLCVCDCGNEIVTLGESLKKEQTKSCGCLHSEIIAERNKTKKKRNQYDLSGEFGIGYIANGQEFYFDLEDYNKIKDHCWYTTQQGYIATNIEGHTIMLHRVIMNFPNEDLDIDHEHGVESRNDNRKSNLRITTRSQNCMNAKIKSNNTSGITGVSFDKSNDKWIAYISVDYKQIHLGSFQNKDDAINARRNAEEKYFGEYSYNNSKKE